MKCEMEEKRMIQKEGVGRGGEQIRWRKETG